MRPFETLPSGASLLLPLVLTAVAGGSAGRAADPAPRHTFRTDGECHGLAYSPDGKRLAWASQSRAPGHVVVWDLGTGKQVLAVEGAGTDVAFGPDGKRVLAVKDEAALLWDVADGSVVRTIKLPPGSGGWAVAYHPGGKVVATAGEKGVRAWDADTGKELWSYDWKAQGSWRLQFSPDGKRLAAGTVLLDATSGAVHRDLGLVFDRARAVAFQPDSGRFAAGASDQFHEWDPGSGAGREVRRTSGSVVALALVADGGTAALGPVRDAGDRQQAWFTTWGGSDTREATFLVGSKEEARRGAISPDGTTFALATWDGIRVWAVADLRPVRSVFVRPAGPVGALALSPDGKTLVVGLEPSERSDT